MRVHRDSGDLGMPAEVGQPVGVSGGDDDVVALVEQRTYQSRADIAGCAGNQDSRGSHVKEVPEPTESKSTHRLLPRTNTPAVMAAVAASTARSASLAPRGLVLVRNW